MKSTRGSRMVWAKARAREIPRGRGLVAKRPAGLRIMKH